MFCNFKAHRQEKIFKYTIILSLINKLSHEQFVKLDKGQDDDIPILTEECK